MFLSAMLVGVAGVVVITSVLEFLSGSGLVLGELVLALEWLAFLACASRFFLAIASFEG